jgi:hypothetical protein
MRASRAGASRGYDRNDTARTKRLRRDIVRPRNLHDSADALGKPRKQLMSPHANSGEVRRYAILF